MDNQKQVILNYLEQAYSESNDAELLCRLSRAIIAFSYDNLEEYPDWDKMMGEYTSKYFRS